MCIGSVWGEAITVSLIAIVKTTTIAGIQKTIERPAPVHKQRTGRALRSDGWSPWGVLVYEEGAVRQRHAAARLGLQQKRAANNQTVGDEASGKP